MSHALIMVGFIVGIVFGIGGSFLPQESLGQGLFWVISALGVIVGSTLFLVHTLRERHDFAGFGMLRERRDLAAAGFGMLAVASSVSIVTNSLMVHGAPAFMAVGAAMYLLHMIALLLITVSVIFLVWVRIAGALAGIAFGFFGFALFQGADFGPGDAVVAIPWVLFAVMQVGFILHARDLVE